MSPKSGTAGSLVAPTAPTAPKEAVDGTTGSISDATNSGSKTGGAGSSVTVAAGSAGSAAGGAGAESAAPQHKPAENQDKTSWIELQLVYESNGLPVAGMAYEVTLPDGETVASGSTDDQGMARVENIDPGSCQISFPKLDKEAWADA